MRQYIERIGDLRREVEDLRAALEHAQALADAEHRAADIARESARRAWQVSLDTTRRRDPSTTN